MNDRAAIREMFGPALREGERLGPHTTFRIGGPADYSIRASTAQELARFVREARGAGLPVLILGRGSNVLVSDAGWRGLVIENHAAEAKVLVETDAAVTILAESGGSLPMLANRLSRKGWTGLEWAVGVPGSIGGGVVGNAGAHGGSMSDIVRSVTILDERGLECELSNADCEFVYRGSRFKRNRGREIVLLAKMELRHDDPEACVVRMNKFAEQRRRAQPTDPSVGSMFKNPPGDYAGRLIEAAGLKGTRVGQVVVSPVHANFFVNMGGATSAQVLELISLVQDEVMNKFAVALELEIELIG